MTVVGPAWQCARQSLRHARPRRGKQACGRTRSMRRFFLLPADSGGKQPRKTSRSSSPSSEDLSEASAIIMWQKKCCRVTSVVYVPCLVW